MIGKAIYSLIIDTENGVGDTIGTRCFPMTAPQGSEYPLVTYEPSPPQPSDTKHGPSTLDVQPAEVVIYSRRFSEAEEIASTLRAMFDRYSGTVATVAIQSVQFQNQSYEHYPEIELYAIVQQYQFRLPRDLSVVITGSPLEQLTLDRLDDVDTTGATDDQVLTYDAATDSWGPEDASTVAALDDLTDVTITTPANNQALVYNSAAGEWRNDALSLTQLEGIDSELGDAIDRQALVFDEASNQWIADGVGQVVIPVRNSYRDDTLTVGQVVKAVGAQGDRIKVELFDPAVDDSKLLVGVISEQIAGGADGHAQVYGELRNISTDTFSVGDILYPQSDGSLDTTENEYPIGIVTRSHQNTGRLFIRLWAPGKGYHQRYRTEALSEMFVGVGATVELYYTATADGDGYVTQDLTAAVGDGNVEERVLYYKAGAFGDSGTTSGYTNAGLDTDATYAEMLTAFNNLLKTEGAPITIYATRTEVSGRSGLLADYPNAAAAYSLRLLDTDYTGSAIRVRRASDNAEQDIGFDGNGDLDTTSLATFCSGTDGFVKVWYDQAGANDATQTTTTAQPKIYDSATGVVTKNGKPAADFLGTAYLPIGVAFPEPFTICIVHENSTLSEYLLGADLQPASYYAGSVPRIYTNTAYVGVALSLSQQRLRTDRYDATNNIANINIDASVNATFTSVGTYTPLTNSALGASSSAGTSPLRGTMQELVYWNSYKSDSDKTGIESNINTYYSIYS